MAIDVGALVRGLTKAIPPKIRRFAEGNLFAIAEGVQASRESATAGGAYWLILRRFLRREAFRPGITGTI